MEHIEPSHELPYISQWGFFLDFEAGEIIQPEDNRKNREKYNAYPIYIKHTLYNNDKNILAIRKTEIS